MILFALLTGVVVYFAWKRHVGWTELLILASWGFLAAGSTIGHYPAEWLASLNTFVATHL